MNQLFTDATESLLNRTSFAKKIKVTTQTVSRWIETLERFYYCFSISPWHKNVTRSLIKEPKIYLWDWSLIEDEGARFENLVALHLKKFIHFYRERGVEKFDLYYLRDIDQKEVDFIITKNQVPYIMIEVKLSDKKITPHMLHFDKQLRAPYNLQLVYNMPSIHQSCFKNDGKIYTAPAITALSQLV